MINVLILSLFIAHPGFADDDEDANKPAVGHRNESAVPHIRPSSFDGSRVNAPACKSLLGRLARLGGVGALVGLGPIFALEAVDTATEGPSYLNPLSHDEEQRLETLLKSESNIQKMDWSDAEILMKYYGVDIRGSFGQMPRDEQLSHLRNLFAELRKLPRKMRDTFARTGRRISAVRDSMTDDPDNAMARGVRPRGWPEGSTWDTVPGAGGYRRSYIACNCLNKGHGSINLVLHEIAHTYEASIRRENPFLMRAFQFTYLNQYAISSSSEFRALHEAGNWPSDYQKNYAEEAFAESTARYFNSATSREGLRTQNPAVYEFLRNHFQE